MRFPKTLKHIYLEGSDFDGPGLYETSIERLSLKEMKPESWDNLLIPPSVKYLDISQSTFNGDLRETNIEILRMDWNEELYSHDSGDRLPKTLKNTIFSDEPN